ncbi:2-oxoacid:acceptor oxidoreductase subunit alpha [Candidatus Bathyarchaeota archaeon]|nr:2-oxoacid:acceptor oxidoreductase subunit alpha [Candidatus Bathyarchaeota archaeon]
MIDQAKRYQDPGQHLLMGNVAMAEGAMAAGLQFFAGYPITPSTEVLELLSHRLPETGGTFIQMEDEIASINAMIGASLAGAKVMTATSGPGTALMAETISMAACLEIPFVICDVQRNGPGTGFVTAPHHNDIMQCKYSGNGEYEVIAFAPMSCQELFDLTIEAFNMAEKFRCPTFILSDAYLGHLHEQVRIPPAKELEARVVERLPPDRETKRFFTFRDDAGAIHIPPPPRVGQDPFPAYLFSQPHGADGIPVEKDRALEFIERICHKVTDNVDSIAMTDEYLVDDADIIIIAYGLPARVSYDVVNKARSTGIAIGLIRLVTVWPFPYEKLKQLIAGKRVLILPEMNQGMIAGEIERVMDELSRIERIPSIGDIHHPDSIMKVVKEVARKS